MYIFVNNLVSVFIPFIPEQSHCSFERNFFCGRPRKLSSKTMCCMFLLIRTREKNNRASIIGNAQDWLYNVYNCIKSSQYPLMSITSPTPLEAQREEIPQWWRHSFWRKAQGPISLQAATVDLFVLWSIVPQCKTFPSKMSKDLGLSKSSKNNNFNAWSI